MAFCVNCGNQIDEGVKFCTSCGAAVSGTPVKTKAEQTSAAEAPAAAPTTKQATTAKEATTAKRSAAAKQAATAKEATAAQESEPAPPEAQAAEVSVETAPPKKKKSAVYCTGCGAAVPDGVKFCTSCGASMTGEPAMPTESAAPMVAPAPTANQTAVISTLGWAGFQLVLLVPIVGLVLYFVWAFGKGNFNLRNHARASLIIMAVFFVLGLLSTAVFWGFLGSISNW